MLPAAICNESRWRREVVGSGITPRRLFVAEDSNGLPAYPISSSDGSQPEECNDCTGLRKPVDNAHQGRTGRTLHVALRDVEFSGVGRGPIPWLSASYFTRGPRQRRFQPPRDR